MVKKRTMDDFLINMRAMRFVTETIKKKRVLSIKNLFCFDVIAYHTVVILTKLKPMTHFIHCIS